MWLGFKTSDCKHWRKVNFYSHVSLRYMAGLYVAGFGATAKGHFQACALCQFFGGFFTSGRRSRGRHNDLLKIP